MVDITDPLNPEQAKLFLNALKQAPVITSHTISNQSNDLTSIEVAEYRVNEALNISSEYLDLSGLNIETLPPNFPLIAPKLAVLNLEKCSDLSDVTALGHCHKLQALNINLCSQIKNWEWLGNLTQLQQLDAAYISKTRGEIKSLVSGLSGLTELQSLNLAFNGLGEHGARLLADHLASVKHLQSINLDGNDIGVNGLIRLSQAIDEQKRLRRLNLSRNSLGSKGAKILDTLLPKVPKLVALSLNENILGDNEIEVLASSIENLAHLESIDLGFNRIGNTGAATLTHALERIHSLKALNLTQNEITSLAPLLPLIKRGLLANMDWKFSGITIFDCPITIPPIEIVKQGREAILFYFEEREAQQTVKLREAKLIIVGEPGVGKTSLVRRLTHSKQGLPEESETTKGINIESLTVTTSSGDPIKLDIWDFGGQEIYHSTHQFFLTKRSLYVLVDSSRTNDTGLSTGIHDERYRYWLDVVASLSERSPLLLFQNQIAGRSKYIDVGSIKSEYPNVQSSDAGDLSQQNAIDSLLKNIIHNAEQLPHIEDNIPIQWLAFREALANLADAQKGNRAYITFDEYLTLYRKFVDKRQTSPKEEFQEALHLSNYFHDLGIFMHFQNEPALAKTVILQNTWVTEAVFKVLDDEKIIEKNGRFTLSDCKRIWHQTEYQDMHSELLALLEKFEICYKLPGASNKRKQDEWLTPQLLQEQPEFLKALQQELQSPTRSIPVMRLHYQYQFLPRGIVSRLMVRMHNHVNDPAKSWNKGVLFELHKADYAKEHNIENSSLLVQLINKPNEIALTAFGPEAKTLQGIITAALDDLNNTFEGLKDKVENLVPCICSECKNSASPWFYKAKTLRKFQEKKRRNAVCEYSGEDVPVSNLLEGLPMDEQSKGKKVLSEFSDAMKKEFYRGEKPLIYSNDELAQEEQAVAGQNKPTSSSDSLQTITLFLASSQDLKAERDAFQLFIADLNEHFIEQQNARIKLIRWEHFLDAVAEQGLQNEYNEKVRSSDIFVSLFHSKVGKYTEQEFDVAFEQFKATQSPKIYTYFYNAPTTQGALNREDTMSLFAFKDKLKEQGHYYTNFHNINHLKEQFRHQLDLLLPQLKKQDQKPKVYLSYAWGRPDERHQIIVDQITNALTADPNIQLISDKDVLKTGNNIKYFEHKIEQTYQVVVILSENSFKSEHCMRELAYLQQNSLSDEATFQQRVIPVVLGEVDIDSTLHRYRYVTYWRKLADTLEQDAQGINDPALTNSVKLYRDIDSSLLSSLSWLADICIAPNWGKAQNDNFAELTNLVKQRIRVNQYLLNEGNTSSTLIF